jgi:phasin family protein
VTTKSQGGAAALPVVQPGESGMTSEIDNATEGMKQQIDKMMQSFGLPDVDISALVENQRRNIEAMSKAAQLTNEAATEVSQRQLEIFRTSSEYLATMFRDMKLSSQQRREIAAKAFEAAVTSARELAEMTAKSNKDVFDLVKQRMTDNFEEMRKMFPGGNWGN